MPYIPERIYEDIDENYGNTNNLNNYRNIKKKSSKGPSKCTFVWIFFIIIVSYSILFAHLLGYKISKIK